MIKVKCYDLTHPAVSSNIRDKYCEYLGSSGGYGSSGGVPEVRESGIWKFGGGTEVRESSFF